MRLTDLTEREREVAELVGDGLDYAQIAGRLRNLRSRRPSDVSARTVRQHVERIADRIGRDGTAPYRAVMRWVLRQRAA